MKRLLIILCFAILSVIPVTAELNPGFYQAEDQTLTDLVYTGTGWTQLVDGDYVVMDSTEQADELAFQFSGRQLVLYRDLLASDSALMQICIDAICSTFTSASTEDQRSVPIAYAVDDPSAVYDVTVTNTDGGTFRLDALLIIDGQVLAEVDPPSPTVQYTQIGDYVAAVDWTISGGDLLTITLLAAVFTALIAQIGIQLWKE